MNMRNHTVTIVVLAVALLICSETCVVMQDAVAAGPEPNLFELRAAASRSLIQRAASMGSHS
jgi:hypothetical protein